MAVSEAEIQDIVSQTPSPSNISALEAYVEAICAQQAVYNFDALRGLLKLYLLFPETVNERLTSHAYMLALLNYPSTDLLALSYMIPTQLPREPCSVIRSCSDHLDACRYADAWKTLEILQNNNDLVIASIAKRATPQLQESILNVLALSYKEAPVSIVKTALNVTSLEALKHPAVESVTATSVVFVPTADNTKRQRVFQQGVSFQSIASLIGKATQQ